MTNYGSIRYNIVDTDIKVTNYGSIKYNTVETDVKVFKKSLIKTLRPLIIV